MSSRERGRDPEGTEKAMLDAAEVLFAKKGFDPVSLVELDEAAQVSGGTLCNGRALSGTREGWKSKVSA